MKNTGQLNPTRDPTQPTTRLTYLKMTRFDPRPIWPANPIDPTNPPILPRLLIILSPSRKHPCPQGVLFCYFSSYATNIYHFLKCRPFPLTKLRFTPLKFRVVLIFFPLIFKIGIYTPNVTYHLDLSHFVHAPWWGVY